MLLPYTEAKLIRKSYWLYLLKISKACPILTISIPPPRYKPPLPLSGIGISLLTANFAATLTLLQSTLHTVARFSQHVNLKCLNIWESWNDFILNTLIPTTEIQLLPVGYTYTSLAIYLSPVQFSSLSHIQLFATPWTAARQASLSITNSQTLLKLMSIESVMIV